MKLKYSFEAQREERMHLFADIRRDLVFLRRMAAAILAVWIAIFIKVFLFMS